MKTTKNMTTNKLNFERPLDKLKPFYHFTSLNVIICVGEGLGLIYTKASFTVLVWVTNVNQYSSFVLQLYRQVKNMKLMKALLMSLKKAG